MMGDDDSYVFYIGMLFSVILALCTGANNAVNLCGVVYGTQKMSFRKILVILFITRMIGTFIMSFQLSKLKASSAMGDNCVEYTGTKNELMEKSTIILAGSSVWLMICTIQGVPVSVSYSIIGAELGYKMMRDGIFNINWANFIEKFIFLGTVGLIVLTLFVSATAYYMFTIMTKSLKNILETYRNLRWWTSYLMEYGVLTVMFVFITYTPISLINFDKIPIYGILPPNVRVFLGLLMVFCWQRIRNIMMRTKDFSTYILTKIKNFFVVQNINCFTYNCKGDCDNFKTHQSLVEVEEQMCRVDIPQEGNSRTLNCCVFNFFFSCNKYVLVQSLFKQKPADKSDDSTTCVNECDGVSNDHANSSIVPGEKTEPSIALRNRWFTRLTEIVVIFSCVAYGGNDVSNSVGSVFVMMKLASLPRILDICEEKISILVLLIGFSVISLGVSLFGKNVMKKVKKLVPLIDEPVRGFCIEMSAVFTIFTYSHLFHLPISITYCKVVAMAAVGLVDNKVNWSLFGRIILFWILTVPVSAFISAFVYWFIL